MTARHLTIRDVPPALSKALLRESRRRRTSLNQTAKELLARALGVAIAPFDNGLGDLAGTWSETQLRRFERDISALGAIDQEQWR